MFISSRRFLLFILFTFLFAGYAQASDLHTVVDQIIQAYGGEQNLRKMDNMTQEWDLVALMGKRHGTDTRHVRSPGKLRVDLNYPEKSETRILNGDVAQSIFNGAPPVNVTGIQLDAMRLQLMRMYSPLMLKSKIGSMSLEESGEFLALSLAENGVHVFYLVNQENWHIEKVAGSLMMNGREIQFLTEYSDFAVIEGVLVHHKENKYASGVNTARLQLRQITFDASLDNSLFMP